MRGRNSAPKEPAPGKNTVALSVSFMTVSAGPCRSSGSAAALTGPRPRYSGSLVDGRRARAAVTSQTAANSAQHHHMGGPARTVTATTVTAHSAVTALGVPPGPASFAYEAAPSP
ncbi:hypothetical protein SGLAM104S_06503 [Streptomyces glaucescens]